MPFSVEATKREAKRQAAIKNQRCVVHRQRVRIALIANAMEAQGQDPMVSYSHPWTSSCRAEAPAERKRRNDLVAEARQASLEDKAIVNGRMAEDD
ncbi:hypothetical protein [Glycomyces buryatensis]|uniref:Uncharacterized protein n=1 Tax=Glycomyces buryatensis TaxID=2570927 RepID=A0A4S8QDR0_9ACTN|nr:hypothetical protein [Glycomyces buryatensis]THV42717.1 hypothetical protein FAB82_04850 [Glycomyces buryatensis]